MMVGSVDDLLFEACGPTVRYRYSDDATELPSALLDGTCAGVAWALW